jgi:hypothetical protein
MISFDTLDDQDTRTFSGSVAEDRSAYMTSGWMDFCSVDIIALLSI